MAIPKIKNYNFDNVNQSIENKVNWDIDPEKCVLLIHDMQNYFVDFYDKNAEPMSSLLKNISNLKNQCKKRGIKTVYTAQPKDQSPEDRALLTDFWGPGLSKDTDLVNIVSELAPQEDDINYTKWRYSALQRTPLQEYMKENGLNQIIICGIYAHIGILATSLDAFMNDIKVFVVSDAIADFSADEHSMALRYISQRCGKTESMNSIKQQLSISENTENKLNHDSIKQDISEVLMLPITEIHNNDNLMYLGLDSIRLMALIEKWQSQKIDINFTDLGGSSTVTDWWEIIQEKIEFDSINNNNIKIDTEREPEHV